MTRNDSYNFKSSNFTIPSVFTFFPSVKTLVVMNISYNLKEEKVFYDTSQLDTFISMIFLYNLKNKKLNLRITDPDWHVLLCRQ